MPSGEEVEHLLVDEHQQIAAGAAGVAEVLHEARDVVESGVRAGDPGRTVEARGHRCRRWREAGGHGREDGAGEPDERETGGHRPVSLDSTGKRISQEGQERGEDHAGVGEIGRGVHLEERDRREGYHELEATVPFRLRTLTAGRRPPSWGGPEESERPDADDEER